MDKASLISEVLARGEDDWVQACQVAEVAKFLGGVSDPEGIRMLSLEIIREILESDFMVPGDVTETGFSPWLGETSSSFARIEHEWKNGELPKSGDVCWLSLRNTVRK